MTRQRRVFLQATFLIAFLHSQGRQEPGHSIDKISAQGDLIVMTLAEGALGKANIFDLVRQTLRFTPDGSSYRVETLVQPVMRTENEIQFLSEKGNEKFYSVDFRRTGARRQRPGGR